MVLSKPVRTGLGIAVAVLLLMLPALWNGYPFIFFDSGDYLTVGLTGQRVIYRDPVYGLLTAPLHLYRSLWCIALGQSLLAAWVIHETVALVLPEGRRMGAYLAISAGLAAGTSLPWFSGQVMPDILGALAVLLVVLLGLGDPRPLKRWTFASLLAVMIASHLSFLPLGIGLVLVLCGLRLFLPAVRLGAVAAAVTVAPAIVLGANLALGGPPTLSETSHDFLLARLVQDGLAKQTLERLCPDPLLRLCAVKESLPATANDFLWGDSAAFALIGGWLDSKEEAERILSASLRLFPGDHVLASVKLSAQQLVWFDTGEGLESQAEPWGVIEAHLPGDFPAYEGARQQKGEMPAAMRMINRLHVPLAGLAMLALPALAWICRRGHRLREMAGLILIGAALAGNAVICGVLSNPNGRYESRMVWLAVFALFLAAADAISRRFPTPAGGYRTTADRGRAQGSARSASG